MSDKLRSLSPLALLGLAACGGGAETGGGGGGAAPVTQSSGTVLKGLLQKALVVVDANRNGQHDGGESTTRTDAQGKFTIDNPNSAPILVLTDDQTTDSASRAGLPGIRMTGSATDRVITPFTGMTNVDTSALATALGLQGVDLLNYDASQLASEQVAQQMVGTLRVVAGVMKGVGRAGDAPDLYGQTFDAMVTVVQARMAANQTVDFDDTALLNDLFTALNLNLTPAQQADVIGQLQKLGAQIDGLGALESNAARAVFSTAPDLAAAYEQGLAAGNSFEVITATQNTPPTELTLTGDLVVDENKLGGGDRTIGSVSARDVEDSTFLTFTLSGPDAGLFQISNGKLVVKDGATVDFTADSLSVTVTATDSGGKSISKTLTLNVTANAAPTISPVGTLVVSETALADNTLAVGNIQIADADSANVTVTLSGADSGAFQIDAGGGLSVRQGAAIDFSTSDPLVITVTATDSLGKATSRQVEILRKPNAAPDLTITPQDGALTVDESAIPNGDTEVATVQATDPDGGTPQLSLTGTDAGLFALTDGKLVVKPGAVIQGPGPLAVTVVATDALGKTTQQALSVAVQQNTAPTLSITNDGSYALDESGRIDGDRLVGTIVAADADGDQVTLDLKGPHKDLFEIGAGNKIVLRSNANVKFSETPKLPLTVVATDSRGATTEQQIEITVTQVPQSDIQGRNETLIKGNLTYGSTLTIVNKLSDPDNGADPTNFASVGYQWYLRDIGAENFTKVNGATNLTFTTTQDMLGKFVAALITTEDQRGGVDRTVVLFGSVLPNPDGRDTPLTIRFNAKIDQARIDLNADVNKMEAGLSAYTKSISTMLSDFGKALENQAVLDAATTSLGSDGQLSIDMDATSSGQTTHSIRVDFDNLTANSYAEFEQLVDSINLSDPATLAVAGQINSMSFESAAGTFQVAYRTPSGGVSQAIDITYTRKDAGGATVGADGDVKTISLLGTFTNGIEPILKALSDVKAVGDLTEPNRADFADDAAYTAAKSTYDTAYQNALSKALTALLGGSGQTAVAGLEGIEVGVRNGGDIVKQMTLDLFSADGSKMVATLGDYKLTVTGKLPTGPGDLLPLFQMDGGIFGTINALANGDGGLTVADFDALVNGVGGNKGLKDGGIQDIDRVQLDHKTGTDTYESVLQVDFDMSKLAAVWDKFDIDQELTEQFPATADSQKLAVAYDVDGIYLVLGEGLDSQSLASTLTWLLPAPDGAVSA